MAMRIDARKICLPLNKKGPDHFNACVERVGVCNTDKKRPLNITSSTLTSPLPKKTKKSCAQWVVRILRAAKTKKAIDAIRVNGRKKPIPKKTAKKKPKKKRSRKTPSLPPAPPHILQAIKKYSRIGGKPFERYGWSLVYGEGCERNRTTLKEKITQAVCNAEQGDHTIIGAEYSDNKSNTTREISHERYASPDGTHISSYSSGGGQYWGCETTLTDWKEIHCSNGTGYSNPNHGE